MTGLRIGTGYDVHRVLPRDGKADPRRRRNPVRTRRGRAFGRRRAAARGLRCALLGALALGDIWQHFPPTDPAYAGISSLLLLERTVRPARFAQIRIVNLDATVIAQAPKLAPYIPAMRETIAQAVGMDVDAVSVKATTEEKLGFTGRGEGIAAEAVVLLEKAE